MTEVQMRQGVGSTRTDCLSGLYQKCIRNISTPAQESPNGRNIMENQAMDLISTLLVQENQVSNHQTFGGQLDIKGRNTDLALGNHSQTNIEVAGHGKWSLWT